MRPSRRRRSIGGMVLAAVIGGLLSQRALADENLVETVGSWIVACHQTEAGGRACEVRNDEDGKPALEQDALLALTLHDGTNDADGLVRIADLDLPTRLEVTLAFGERSMTLEGVGRRGRLAARFAMTRQELAGLAAADAIEVRFVDNPDQDQTVLFATEGLGEALKAAQEHLSQ